MSEHDEIEKKLQAYRERRDRDLPADRRMLPVQKDQLLAEARRRYGPRAATAWFSPMLRWASVATPVLILAVVGYFWFGVSKDGRKRATRMEDQVIVEQSPPEAPMPLEARRSQIGQEKKEMLFSSEMDSRSSPELAKAPANRNEPVPSVVARKPASVPAAPPLEEQVVAGSVEANADMAQTMVDVSGQYQARAPARDKIAVQKSKASTADAMMEGKDRAAGEKMAQLDEKAPAKAQAENVSNFANFKLVQAADVITLVDAEGTAYTGRLVLPQQVGNFQAGAASSTVSGRQNSAGAVQQASLVGTNRATREVVHLVANFYADAGTVEGESAGARMKRDDSTVQAAGTNLQKQIQFRQLQRMSVVLERMDLKGNRQERVAEAERANE